MVNINLYNYNTICVIVSPKNSVQANPKTINATLATPVSTFMCSSKGGIDNQYQWTYKRTGHIESNESVLNINSQASAGGIYECLVSNAAGKDSVTVTLNGTYI